MFCNKPGGCTKVGMGEGVVKLGKEKVIVLKSHVWVLDDSSLGFERGCDDPLFS